MYTTAAVDGGTALAARRILSADTRFIAWAGLFCSLMPYIGYARLPSDVQPLALLFCTAGMALVLRDKGFGGVRISQLAIPLWIMVLAATVSMVWRAAFDDVGYIWLIRAYYGYLSAPIILAFFLHYFRVLHRGEIVTAVDLAVGVTFLGFVLNLTGLTWIVQVFVNRAEFEGFVRVSRGFTGFFPEQSRVSEQIGFFFFCYLLIGRLTGVRIAALVVAAVLSAAGQVFAVFVHILLAYGLALGIVTLMRRRVPIRALWWVGLGAVGASWLLSVQRVVTRDLRLLGFPARGISAVSGMMDGGLSYVGRDVGMMSKIAGLLHAMATLVSEPLTFKLAATADRPEFRESIVDTYAWLSLLLFNSTILWFPARVSSALGLWIIEFGVLGLIAAVFFVALLIRRALRSAPATRLPALWAALFLAQVLFVKVALANPSLWLLAALIWVAAAPAAAQSSEHARRADPA